MARRMILADENLVSRDSSELLSLITDNQGKRPAAELLIGSGVASPVWSPQIRYRRNGVLLIDDFVGATTDFSYTFTQSELYWLFNLANVPGFTDVTGTFPTNKSLPKRLAIQNAWFVANGNATGSASGLIQVDYFLLGTGASIPIPIIRQNYSSIVALATFEPRIAHPDHPAFEIPLQGTASWVKHSIVGGETILFDDEALIDGIRLRITASVTITPVVAGMNFFMEF